MPMSEINATKFDPIFVSMLVMSNKYPLLKCIKLFTFTQYNMD